MLFYHNFLLFSFLIIIDLYLLITLVITQLFHPTGEFLTLTIISNREVKAEVQKEQLTAETKIRACSM